MLANPILGPKIQYLRYRFQNPVAARYAHATLAVTAFLSAVVYTFVLLAPFNLLDLQHRRLFDLYRASQSDPQVLLKLVAALIALGVLYWLAWRSALRVRDQRAGWIVVGAASGFGLALLLMDPYDAADIFDNIRHGRIISVYGANPFQATPSPFKIAPLFGYTAWPYTVTAYGPVWEVLSAAGARAAGGCRSTHPTRAP